MSDVRTEFGREAHKYLTSKTHGDQDEIRNLVSMVTPQGGRVIDLATGAGHCGFVLSPLADEVILCDLTPQMLEVAIAEAEKRGLSNLKTLQADVHSVPLPDASLDGAVCRLAAHHFRRPTEFLTEVYRLLKPGAWFLFVDTVGIEGHEQASNALDEFETIRDPSHVRDHLASEWNSWINSSGFEITDQRSLHHRYPLVSWMDRMSVAEPNRTRLSEILRNADGALRDYLEPEESSESELSFLLHQTAIAAIRK